MRDGRRALRGQGFGVVDVDSSLRFGMTGVGTVGSRVGSGGAALFAEEVEHVLEDCFALLHVDVIEAVAASGEGN